MTLSSNDENQVWELPSNLSKLTQAELMPYILGFYNYKGKDNVRLLKMLMKKVSWDMLNYLPYEAFQYCIKDSKCEINMIDAARKSFRSDRITDYEAHLNEVKDWFYSVEGLGDLDWAVFTNLLIKMYPRIFKKQLIGEAAAMVKVLVEHEYFDDEITLESLQNKSIPYYGGDGYGAQPRVRYFKDKKPIQVGHVYRKPSEATLLDYIGYINNLLEPMMVLNDEGDFTFDYAVVNEDISDKEFEMTLKPYSEMLANIQIKDAKNNYIGFKSLRTIVLIKGLKGKLTDIESRLLVKRYKNFKHDVNFRHKFYNVANLLHPTLKRIWWNFLEVMDFSDNSLLLGCIYALQNEDKYLHKIIPLVYRDNEYFREKLISFNENTEECPDTIDLLKKSMEKMKF